jgi:hypothetical protein
MKTSRSFRIYRLHSCRLAYKPNSGLDHRVPTMAVDANKTMQLMQPMFEGNKDKYGKEAVRKRCHLSPSPSTKAMEGRPPSTSAPLFGLLYGILSKVVQHVDHISLNLLTLVNSDCQQWARSAQFNSICLDYKPSSWSLL